MVDLQFYVCVCVCVKLLSISIHMQMWVSKFLDIKQLIFFSCPPFRRALGRPGEMEMQADQAQGLVLMLYSAHTRE